MSRGDECKSYQTLFTWGANTTSDSTPRVRLNNKSFILEVMITLQNYHTYDHGTLIQQAITPLGSGHIRLNDKSFILKVIPYIGNHLRKKMFADFVT